MDISLTPQTVYQALSRQQYSLALNMSLHLGEQKVLKTVIDSIVVEAIQLVIKSLDVRMIKLLMSFIAKEMVSRRVGRGGGGGMG